tara:strand:+ start:109 stop:228 length:120 start_codon:yes stop_codon:yes gene_type:complete
VIKFLTFEEAIFIDGIFPNLFTFVPFLDRLDTLLYQEND